MNSLLIIIFALSIPNSPEHTLFTPEKIEIILEGQEAILNGYWEDAYRIYDELHQIDTTDPAGYLFRAAVLQAEMMDKEENLYGNRLKSLCDSTKLLSERRLNGCSLQDSALCYLYIGHQYAYRSLWEMRFGSKISALSCGFKVKGQYHKGLKVDSTLYDLYLGLGSYHYWKSVKSGILKLAGIFKDDKDKGIAEIELAVDSSLFSKEASRAALIWIMIREKNYDSAIALSKVMLQKYPDGNSFLWPLAESYYRAKRYEEAAGIYSLTLERLQDNPGNYYNIIESTYWLCSSYEKLGEKDKAKESAAYLSSVYSDIPRGIRRKQRSKLGYLLGRNR